MSLTDIIIAGLAGVKPATLKQAPAGANPRPENMPALGMADDTVKRYYFYSCQLTDEINGLIGKADELAVQIFGTEQQRYFGEFIVGLCDGSKAQLANRLADLHAEIGDKHLVLNQVTGMFWTEAKRRNPKLQAHNVALHADWTFSSSEQGELGEPLDLDRMTIRVFSVGGLDSAPVGLASIIKRAFGDNKPPRERDYDRSDRAAA